MQVGLTGGIGSGKSTVSALLASYGAVVIDSDALAREVVAPGTPGLSRLVAELDAALTPDGSLDRPALGSRVFADPQLLAQLNAIVHPLVGRRGAELAAAAPPGAIVVHDVPLLVENDLQGRYDEVVVVLAGADVQRDRLVRLRGMSEADARARMAAQVNDAARRAVATEVLDNSGPLAALEPQVRALWVRLLARGDVAR